MFHFMHSPYAGTGNISQCYGVTGRPSKGLPDGETLAPNKPPEVRAMRVKRTADHANIPKESVPAGQDGIGNRPTIELSTMGATVYKIAKVSVFCKPKTTA